MVLLALHYRLRAARVQLPVQARALNEVAASTTV
jgi:hypothetical protein